MKKFDINKLTEKVKGIYEAQIKWNEKCWRDSLAENGKKIEILLHNLELFDVWERSLKSKFKVVNSKFTPEILMDGYISVHLSCTGLYKQAHASMRLQLESVLRLIYFSQHPIEFGWWIDEDDYFKKRDVWADGFHYFKKLENYKNFLKKCKANGYGGDFFDDIANLYSKLSKFVHGGPTSFHTSGGNLSPKYKKNEFNKWLSNFVDLGGKISLILILGFPEEFKAMTKEDQKKILNTIKDKKLKKAIIKTIGIKLRGRV